MIKQSYAISVGDAVLANTVSSHARGAMVNYLHLRGYAVPNVTPDEAVRQYFLSVLQAENEVGMRVELVLVPLFMATPVDAAAVALVQQAPDLRPGDLAARYSGQAPAGRPH